MSAVSLSSGAANPMTETNASARAYARIRYRLLLVHLVVWPALLVWFYCSGLSRVSAAWWAHRTTHDSLVMLGYLLCFGLVRYVVLFPLHFYGSFLVEHQFQER